MLNPWLIPFAIVPLLLIHRALSVQKLEVEARVDPKTGLFNARHFATTSPGRAQPRQAVPAADVADHGRPRPAARHQQHLRPPRRRRRPARDRGRLPQASSAPYDVPARFGGEEFSILLPETSPEEALEIAERVRRAVAARTYEVETSSEPIRATISMGVAAFPRDGSDANELVHAADVAVYRAKLQGRNRVLDAADDETILAHPAEHAAVARLAAHAGAEARAACTVPLAVAPLPWSSLPGAASRCARAHGVHQHARTRRRRRASCRSRSVSRSSSASSAPSAPRRASSAPSSATRRTTSGSGRGRRSSVSARRCRSRWRRPARSP